MKVRGFYFFASIQKLFSFPMCLIEYTGRRPIWNNYYVMKNQTLINKPLTELLIFILN